MLTKWSAATTVGRKLAIKFNGEIVGSGIGLNHLDGELKRVEFALRTPSQNSCRLMLTHEIKRFGQCEKEAASTVATAGVGAAGAWVGCNKLVIQR